MRRTGDISKKINILKTQHRILDDKIVALEADLASDQLTIQRLKRQKRLLRDEVSRLQTNRLPDIIAWT